MSLAIPPFVPLFRNPHLQTIAAHYWPRPHGEDRWPTERRIVRTAPDTEVLVESQRPEGEARGEIVMVHGLEGSGSAGYMRSLAATVLQAGFAAHRFNLRSCGGTEALTQTLYHAGLVGDLAVLLHIMRAEGRAPAVLVGFSLGANVVLKLAGECGDDGPSLFRAACGISSPIDLEACSRRIGQFQNRIYERRFVRRMHTRLLATGRFQAGDLAGLRSVYAIDEHITAPSFGFGTAKGYYRTQSARVFLAGARVPVLLIQAQDDPLVPFATFRDLPPRVRLVSPKHGGHLGFLARGRERFWADRAVLAWIESL